MAWVVSAATHGGVLLALYAVPSAVHRRFATTGQSQVIAIEASLGNPTAMTAVTQTVPTEPLTSRRDAKRDRWMKIEPAEKYVAERPIDRLVSDRRDLPKAAPPPRNPTSKTSPELRLRRRPAAEQSPAVKPPQEPPRPKQPRPIRPPSVTVAPMKQFAGAEKRTAADLSKNQPPIYPARAVLDRSQGTVLLKLTIDPKGRVMHAEVAESSGFATLDQAAVEAVSRWNGSPAKRWGVPVQSTEFLPIRFRL